MPRANRTRCHEIPDVIYVMHVGNVVSRVAYALIASLPWVTVAGQTHNEQAVGFNQYTSPVPLLKSWNFTVQRQPTGNTMFDVGYIGSHGSRLAFTKDVNQVDYEAPQQRPAFNVNYAWSHMLFIPQTGSPFTPYMAVNKSYAMSSNMVWYPNVVGDPLAVPGGRKIDSWFNVNAFAAPTPGTFGNMGRNVVYGPKLTAVNASLAKTFDFTERLKLEFSASASNLLNHPSFALPDRQIGPGHKGQITGASVGSREMELIAKFRF